MKHVVSADMVAHLWANQLQSDARVSGTNNFYFEDDCIYSYGRHFVIAKHVVNNDVRAILYTDRTYSNTTSKHQSMVHSAMQGQDIIIVPDADNSKSSNFEAWKRRITNLASNLLTARKPEKYLNPINTEYANVCKYADFWGVEIPTDLRELYESVLTPQYKTYLKDRAATIKETERLQKIKDDAAAVEHLEKWRIGEVERHVYDGFTYLKLSADGAGVQTSQGVFIPLDIAKTFYHTVLKTVKNGGCTDCNMRFMHQYNVREITEKQIVIGCHTITIDEIKLFTQSQNW